MKINFNFKKAQISKFFEDHYVSIFAVLFVVAIGVGSTVFYFAIHVGSEAGDESTAAALSTDIATLQKIKELLDVRMDTFNKLRAAKPSIALPY